MSFALFNLLEAEIFNPPNFFDIFLIHTIFALPIRVVMAGMDVAIIRSVVAGR